MSYEDFKNKYTFYSKIFNVSYPVESRNSYLFLSQEKSVEEMIKAIKVGEPPLNGVVAELETSFHDFLATEEADTINRMIGAMISEILSHEGYRPDDKKKKEVNSTFFKLAQLFTEI
jgi:hypothetical protein